MAFAVAGACGLVQPVSAEMLDLESVNDYVPRQASPRHTSSREQVTSITQFSDVYPTDWAYQALASLIERYGCVAGYPNGTFRGNRAMTRYEAAAFLNACLDRITRGHRRTASSDQGIRKRTRHHPWPRRWPRGPRR